jgi:hypothetical protein
VLPVAIRRTGDELSRKATEPGVRKIYEREHMQPALRTALTEQLGSSVLVSEPKLHFEHWQGIPERKGVGGVDIAVAGRTPNRFRALIELKWCPLDSPYLGWALWDFFKMATGRDSPGADSC